MVDDEDLEVEEGEIDTLGDDSEAAPYDEGPIQNAREMFEKIKRQRLEAKSARRKFFGFLSWLEDGR